MHVLSISLAACFVSVCHSQQCGKPEDGANPVSHGSVMFQRNQFKGHVSSPVAPHKDAEERAVRRFTGEFHSPIVSATNIVELLKQPECRNFYAIGDLPLSPTVVDHDAKLFRPAAEIEGLDGSEPSVPPTVMKRLITYEDVAFPSKFHSTNVTGTVGTAEDFHRDEWCEMFAIRTPQRPVKVVTAEGFTSLAMPAIWKVASTTITSMLAAAAKNQSASKVSGPHDHRESIPPNPLAQAEKHTSFHQDAADANVKVAIVRSPLDRFLASVYEHGEWTLCNGQPCDDVIATAKQMANKLARDFPHSYRSCEHPSQVYFLSATDLHGEPFVWDHVFHLEELDAGLKQVQDSTGIAMVPKHENDSGSTETKRTYFAAIFQDLETLCSICKVYAQDFKCLGYAMPDTCTVDDCSKVGISLKPTE